MHSFGLPSPSIKQAFVKAGNHFTKYLIASFISLLAFGSSAVAQTVTIDGINYRIQNKKATVLARSHGKQYKGDINIPSSIQHEGKNYPVTSIDGSAFYQCRDLTSVVIPEGVKAIEGRSFWNCQGLVSVVIPKSVKHIGPETFWGCQSLVSVNIPEGLTTIEKEVFSGCKSVTSVVIPKSVTSIGNGAFSSCYSLTSVDIPEGVTSIGIFAFANCRSLPSVVIPKSVTSIGDNVFWGCEALSSVVIPEGVTSIGSSAFDYCTILSSIVIPKGVTSIENSTFAFCRGLTSVVIPESVTSVGYKAFYVCPKLQDIYCYAINPPTIDPPVFDDEHYANVTLYVPEGAKEAYSTAQYWRKFKNIVEMQEAAIDAAIAPSTAVDAIYSLDGKTVAAPKAGEMYIYRTKDGKAVKRVAK